MRATIFALLAGSLLLYGCTGGKAPNAQNGDLPPLPPDNSSIGLAGQAPAQMGAGAPPAPPQGPAAGRFPGNASQSGQEPPPPKR